MHTKTLYRLSGFIASIAFLAIAVLGSSCSSEKTAVLNNILEDVAPPALSDAEVLANLEHHLTSLEWKRLVPIAMATEPSANDSVGFRYYECWNAVDERAVEWGVSRSDRLSYNVSVTLEEGRTMMNHSVLAWEYFPNTGTVARRHAGSYC